MRLKHSGCGGRGTRPGASRSVGRGPIGIDEISRKRGHGYVTNVYNLKRRRLLWSGEGQARETLATFFAWFGSARAERMEDVCCDMWQPYVEVVKERAHHAILVFDKFHIVQHLTQAVNQVRRDEIREKGKDHKELMAKTWYIWLENPWNLTDKQQARLSALEQLNLMPTFSRKSSASSGPIPMPDGPSATSTSDSGGSPIHASNPCGAFAGMLRRHDDLTNYFSMPIHNGTVEGLNNKAKVISHKAYGFRTPKNYIRNLYHCIAEPPLHNIMRTFA